MEYNRVLTEYQFFSLLLLRMGFSPTFACLLLSKIACRALVAGLFYIIFMKSLLMYGRW